jgi:trehalose 6-phosphate synthase
MVQGRLPTLWTPATPGGSIFAASRHGYTRPVRSTDAPPSTSGAGVAQGETAARPRHIVVASNRGPVTFRRHERGEVEAKRGLGGLVTALTGALDVVGGLWVAAAMSEEDRRQATAGGMDVGLEGASGRYRVRYLAFDEDTYDGFYNGIANRVLWFCHHFLWDVPREPQFTRETRRAWDAYRRVNAVFAEALAEEVGRRPGEDRGSGDEPDYLVQDYQLALVPEMLRQRRPGARIAHFTHIPFAGPSYFRALPERMRTELLAGYLGADVVGFHARRWAENFLLCCRALSGAEVSLDRGAVRWQGREVRVRVNPISVDVTALRREAASARVASAMRRVERWRGDPERRLLLRVDRTDLSKNILRGLFAYHTFLAEHREWHGRVFFLCLLNPSRQGLPEYRRYLLECRRKARETNRAFGRDDWLPVKLSVKDDHALTLAAYGVYDALLVNPVFDGLNLVAKEGPVLNGRDGVEILSRNAGAFPELRDHALGINPFDVAETAEAIAAALEMDRTERERRAAGLRRAVSANPLDRWVTRQTAELRVARGP